MLKLERIYSLCKPDGQSNWYVLIKEFHKQVIANKYAL